MSQSRGYGQFCPISRATEILGERWTPLLLRELLCGSVRFNDLQRGLPRISSAMLSKRLKDLEHSRLVERRAAAKGGGWEYHLTAAGRELFPVLEGMGNWAQRWMRDDLTADANLDPDLLMWDIRRRVVLRDVPRSARFVTRFEFAGVPANRRRYWLLLEQESPDLCLKDPGFDVDLYVSSDIRTMVRIWLGHDAIDAALRDEKLALEGSAQHKDAFRRWFGLSLFAPAGRDASRTAPEDSVVGLSA